jgi:hypothetical protein
MNIEVGSEGTPEPRNAPSEAEERHDASPVEFQPESGALGPRDPTDDAELERDPREDL